MGDQFGSFESAADRIRDTSANGAAHDSFYRKSANSAAPLRDVPEDIEENLDTQNLHRQDESSAHYVNHIDSPRATLKSRIATPNKDTTGLAQEPWIHPLDEPSAELTILKRVCSAWIAAQSVTYGSCRRIAKSQHFRRP